ncbi:polyprenyl synthetase family protein [Nocardia bovistercoris]|uniref:Polyprenyl synthetase family protein n=1 Tax=Nocardia bovistercoris TaxID=2785916 RepID=A0A931N2J2_9NOCA|nr:polyprenyl synthetase family protein [Nocardia bovistercoris]MBH0775568.1 polyprenyl synthetase family protein [Nocardia bovistercoris]
MIEMTSAADRRRADEILTSARTLCEPALRAAIGSLPEPLRTMGGYHFGWCDADGASTTADSGKALRPALTLGAAVACGAPARAAIDAAAATELVHNFTLLHDDVMDGDRNRRGRPAVWAVWGVADAILLGDAMHALAVRTLVGGLPAAVAAAAVAHLEQTVIEMCRGQHEDCRLGASGRADVDEYGRMAMAKTGSLMGCACALGALCAGADTATVARMTTFGRELGMAFQFVDDVMGIWGDPNVTGKPAGDLARRTMSLPVVAALSSDGIAASELAAMYDARPGESPMDTERAAALVESAGGRRRTLRAAQDRVEAAIAALADPSSAADLVALAHLVSCRDR